MEASLTAWTDIALALEAAVLGGLLWSADLARRAWSIALCFLGLSALAGGLLGLGVLDALPLAEIRDLSVAGVTTFGIVAHARHFLARPWRGRVILVAGIYAALFIELVLQIGGFLVVVGLYAPVMLALLVWHALRIGSRGLPLFIAGIAACFVAAAVLVSKLSVAVVPAGALYHLVMMAAVALLYAAGRDLSERESSAD